MVGRAGIIGMAWFCGVAAAMAAGVGADREAGGVGERARAAILGWMEAEDRISQERADWEAEKASMAELLALHRRELALLDEELAKAGMSAAGHEERMKGGRMEMDRLRSVREKVAGTVAAAVPRMRRLARMFPAPLRAELREELLVLDAWQPGDEPRDGLRALLGVVSKAEAFHRRVTRAQELRGGREVEVIYLGLARAFFHGGGRSGTGVPGPDGWVWREVPELEKPLERVLAVLDKKGPPEMVKLPVRIMDVGKKEGEK